MGIELGLLPAGIVSRGLQTKIIHDDEGHASRQSGDYGSSMPPFRSGVETAKDSILNSLSSIMTQGKNSVVTDDVCFPRPRADFSDLDVLDIEVDLTSRPATRKAIRHLCDKFFPWIIMEDKRIQDRILGSFQLRFGRGPSMMH